MRKEKLEFTIVWRSFSSFGVPKSSFKMMVDGIILGQVSFTFSGSLFYEGEGHFCGRGTIPEGPKSFLVYHLSS